jgi:hypothetical protein
MPEVVLAHLPVVIAKPVGIRFGFQKQQQTHILIRVGSNQHGLGRLKILFPLADVLNSGYSSA